MYDSNSPTASMVPCNWLSKNTLFQEVSKANSTMGEGRPGGPIKDVLVYFALYISDKYREELPDVPVGQRLKRLHSQQVAPAAS